MDYSQYTCIHDCFNPPPPGNDFVGFVLVLLPLVLVGVFLWRQRGSRDARDVLKSGPHE